MKRRYRLVLDAVMMALAALLYRKNVISLAFHEAAGLALGALFVVHLAFNRKWIAAVSANFRATNGRTKALAVIDALLAVSWLASIVTGILISKKVFALDWGGAWIRAHFFTSAVALILTGVHLAMHRHIFASFFRKRWAVPAIVILTLASLYGVTFLNMGTWLSAPFIPARNFDPRDSADGAQEGRRKGRGHPHGEEPFSLVAVIELAGGVLGVVLLANAGEYAAERLILRRRGKNS
ncbi:MAG: DUF4405 domain-containing protein [Synergistaceae bacterium]|nr:DUF4405 domain-containing protein [Synergistaceae bacterium]